ncbi:ATP-binding cassette, subfamily B [Halolactibacillus halophilus]|uniref:ABC transporter ATP-binding protein YknV n=1 Tax=Halolactibacillus halophilus TaxID=306540 RepID=A0A1I5N778_9BACI|nr:ABC transporter ATP-binding protein [Halolactibacillus halophilus]GEM01210.1 putative ABC transporter ATP-binding protein YknV [Halolactibacillus halophilus]SFP17584.1 ATP-binding cassette, subfamily B [Halolactibacillus halophilus]
MAKIKKISADSAYTKRFFYPQESAVEKPFNWKQMARLLNYLKPYMKTLVPLAMAVMLINMIVRLTVPILIGDYVVDRAIADRNTTLLMYLIIGIAVLYLANYIANRYRIKIVNTLGQKTIYDLREELFSHVQRLSHNFFDNRSAGSILVRILNDVNSLQELFTNGIINLLMDMMMLIGIVAILFFLSPQLALAVLVILPVMFYISTKLRRNIRRSWQDVRLQKSRLNSHLNESIQGVRITQSFIQEEENTQYFNGVNANNFEKERLAMKKSAYFGPFVELSNAIGTVILIAYGSHLIINETISVGIFVSFAFYLGMFWEPISRLGQIYNQLLVAMASSERIFEFLDEQPNVDEKDDALPFNDMTGHITFDHVRFSYDDERIALHDISLDIKPGTTVALVGHTGSGKSTIANLISRFYDPTNGRVLIDGQDLRDMKVQSLRSHISVVLQDTFIFSGSIMENIRFGRPEATDEEVMDSAKIVGAHEFIMRLANGYETEVEERGNILSAGERQLLSFARALLANPKILILDEATASIDTEAEMKIQEALKKLLKGRTAIMIAHRLSTIREADNIIVLEHGEILEQGNHNQLIEHEGEYYQLVKSQFEMLDEL